MMTATKDNANQAILESIAADPLSRDNVIRALRNALKRRSLRKWSVTGGRGTAWGWITITARKADSSMDETERKELALLFGLEHPVHFQGLNIPASNDYRREYLDRAEGRMPSVTAVPYWD